MIRPARRLVSIGRWAQGKRDQESCVEPGMRPLPGLEALMAREEAFRELSGHKAFLYVIHGAMSTFFVFEGGMVLENVGEAERHLDELMSELLDQLDPQE